MRAAQRSERFFQQSTQQVEILTGITPEAAAVKLSEMVAQYAIRVVTLSHWQQPGHHNLYGITVVFEEEPNDAR